MHSLIPSSMVPSYLFQEQPLAWVRSKCKPTQFADNKNRPGTDYANPIIPIHRNHKQRLIKAVADLNIVLSEDLPEGCEPHEDVQFNIGGCITGRTPSDRENQSNTPKDGYEPEASA